MTDPRPEGENPILPSSPDCMQPPAAAPIEDFIGCLHRPGTKPLSTAEIGEIAAQVWAGRR